jgi:hypothetical protein
MYSRNTNNKIGIQCVCWFYSQGIYHDARSYNPKIYKFTLCLNFPSTFSRQQLTGDWQSENMATATNKQKSFERPRKFLNHTRNRKGGEKADMCREFGHSTIQMIWKNRSKITSNLKRTNRE